MIVKPLYDKFFPRPDFLRKHDIKIHQEHLNELMNRYKTGVLGSRIQKYREMQNCDFPSNQRERTDFL